MKEVQRELRTAFRALDEIDAQQCAKLPFLNACISESLRLLPPLAGKFMSRRSPGAMIDGIWVPFGTQVYVDPYTVQRSPNAFAHPDEFRPERFLQRGEVGKYQHDLHEVYKPFSSGPRTCIGREMALQSIRLTIAKLLFKYDVEFTSPDCFIWERDSKSSALWAEYRLPVRVTAVRQ
jgi:cytochrome P450